MRKILALVLVLAVGVALGAFGKSVLGAQAEKVGDLTRTTLLKTVATDARTEAGNPLDIYVFDVTVAPGGIAPRHTHPGNETFVVVSGAGTFQEDGKPEVELKPGVTVHIDPNKVHTAKASSAGFRLIDFGVYEAGKPPTSLAK